MEEGADRRRAKYERSYLRIRFREICVTRDVIYRGEGHAAAMAAENLVLELGGRIYAGSGKPVYPRAVITVITFARYIYE